MRFISISLVHRQTYIPKPSFFKTCAFHPLSVGCK